MWDDAQEEGEISWVFGFSSVIGVGRTREPDKSVFAEAWDRARLGAWVDVTELMKLITSKMTKTRKKCRIALEEMSLDLKMNQFMVFFGFSKLYSILPLGPEPLPGLVAELVQW